MEHIMARAWFEASGDSFVVDAREVVGAVGAAAYLAKYVTKAALSYETLQLLGFTRRWSASRDWPREERLQLRVTRQRGWGRSEWIRGSGPVGERAGERVKETGRTYLAQRTGSKEAWDQDEKMTLLRGRRQYESIRKKVLSSGRGYGDG